MSTAQDLYSEHVQALPPPQQLRLATMILQGLDAAAAMTVDHYSDEWSDEDLRDAAKFSLRHATERFGEE